MATFYGRSLTETTQLLRSFPNRNLRAAERAGRQAVWVDLDLIGSPPPSIIPPDNCSKIKAWIRRP
jgi:hypothetical protein